MLEPRVYRTGMIVAALALVVLGFSLRNQQGALAPTLPPEAFNGQNAYGTMERLASPSQYPDRAPGSNGDDALATYVAQKLAGDQFTVSTDTFSAHTVDGTRAIENVIGVLPGQQSGSIVIVAPRDAEGSPAIAGMSATATLLELARVLQGETLNRTVVLASTSGSQGTAGAIRLASTLQGQVDAALVIGDVASAHPRQPIVVPWAMRPTVAPPMLRNTLASAIADQTSLSVAFTGLAGQFAHLALPLTLSEQAPFAAVGVPAVTLSLSGEIGPAADAPVSGEAQMAGMGRAVLQTISALDSGPALAPPSAYLLLSGKVVPAWAVSLFVLALIVPVVVATADGLARARRRGYMLWRSLGLILAAAVPFAGALLVVIVAQMIGVFAATPPAPVAPGAVPLRGAGVAVLVLAGLVIVGGAAGVRSLAMRLRSAREASDPIARDGRAGRPRRGARRRVSEHSSDGLAAVLLAVMCCVTLVIWVGNPFAALLLVPALHIWLWALDSDLSLPAVGRLALVAIGIAPVIWVIVYYGDTLGFGVVQIIWAATLMVAGHGVSVLGALEGCIVMGCLVGAAAICVLAARGPRVESAAITVRGPVNYAGPGSLGGTKSALRR
jgi:hypothetical protein